MKRIMMVVCLMMVFLVGCSRSVWETVNDTESETQAVSWSKRAHMIQTQLPDDVQLVEQTDSWKIYASGDGKLEVEVRTMLASDPESAIEMLSGFSTGELNILETKKFGMQEYQFAWVSETDGGSRLYRACLVMDDTECYAITCSVAEEQGDERWREIRQVFSTFGLSTDDSV